MHFIRFNWLFEREASLPMIPNGDYPILAGDSEFLAILAPACREPSIIARSICSDESKIDASTNDFVKV
jgi:hypothetical protein